MKYDEFVATVRDRGEYESREEAERVCVAVLQVLASRVTGREAENLASQMPGTLGDTLREGARDGRVESFGVAEFYRRVAELAGARPSTAQGDAGAVLSTLADSVSGGEVNQIISQLPSGYATLFGKPDLSE